ncbi:MAG: hypothetical protein Q4C42_06245 [Clostridia bacterium]|nr:hypothetical protein [Clostridia bacterium]
MKNIKKILALMLVLCMAMAFTGCVSTSGTSSSSTAKIEISEEEQNPDMSSYTNDFAGIVDYLTVCEVLAGEGEEMAHDFIGAVNGAKFSYKYEGTTVTCEIYEFDTENLNEKAEETIASVKENGTFSALHENVEAVLSDSDKFLMVYRNSDDEKDDVQKAFTERTMEKFTSFVGK